MPTYTVKSIENRQNFKYKNGPMAGKDGIDYTLILENSEGRTATVSLSQMASTKVPEVGSTLLGEVEKTDFGMKFKKEKPPQGGGGGGYRGGPRPDDPATRDSIERQVAVKAAAEVFGRAGKIPSGDEVLNLTAAFLEAMRSKAA